MKTNSQLLVQKADSILNFGLNGMLNGIQSDSFVQMMQDKTSFLKDIRVVKMGGPKVDINRLGIGQRILHRRSAQGVALDDAKKGEVNTDKITLESKEVIAKLYIDAITVEDSIQKNYDTNRGVFDSPGGIHQLILQLIADRASLDLSDLAINGDSTIDPAVDDFLSLNSGFVKLATANVYAAANAHISPTTMFNTAQMLPTRFLNSPDLKYFMSIKNERKLRAQLANRATPGGDKYMEGNGSLQVFGDQAYSLPLIPDTVMLYTYPKNLIFGIQRDIRIRSQLDIDTDKYKIVLTARVDFKVEDINAISKATGLNSGALT